MTRFWLSALIATAIALPTISAQSPGGTDSPGSSLPIQRAASCQSLPGDAPSELAAVSSFQPEPAYVELPIEQLKKLVPLLNPTIHEEAQLAGVGAWTNETDFILGKAGAVITELLHTTPNLTANEQVRQMGQSLYSGHLNVSGLTVNRPTKWNNTSEYEYRIAHKRNPLGGDALVEFRTDARGQPIDDSATSSNRPINVGFATVWLIFLPGNLHDSRFRYLGEQSIGRRKTYVLAFAQNPESTGLQPVISFGSGQCIAPLQGVAWIDRSTYQIVRIQTDLLYSLPDIDLSQLRAVLTYESVKIAGLNLSLWLPRDVDATVQTTFRNVQEFHHYTNYRLFQTSMRVLPGFEMPQK
jgi:hypothetical protein